MIKGCGAVCRAACLAWAVLLLCGCAEGTAGKVCLPSQTKSATADWSEGERRAVEQQLADMERELQRCREDYLAELQRIQCADGATPSEAATSSERNELSDVIGVTGRDYTYQRTSDGLVLSAYHGTATSVSVPAALDGVRVVGIADRAFAETAVVRVVLPPTVRSVGWFAFYDCAQLQEVVLPASVERIGYAAFDGCHPQLTLHVREDSFAHRYALSFALRHRVAAP